METTLAYTSISKSYRMIAGGELCISHVVFIVLLSIFGAIRAT